MYSEEKAAILLLSLDEEQAAEVMKNLRSAEVRRISKYMSRITSTSASDVQEVAKEFCELAKEKGGILSVKEDVAKNIVLKVLGPEQAGSILTAPEGEKDKFSENPIFEKLRKDLSERRVSIPGAAPPGGAFHGGAQGAGQGLGPGFGLRQGTPCLTHGSGGIARQRAG